MHGISSYQSIPSTSTSGVYNQHQPRFGMGWRESLILPLVFMGGSLLGQMGPYQQGDYFEGLDTAGIHKVHVDYTPGEEKSYFQRLSDFYFRLSDQVRRKDPRRCLDLREIGLDLKSLAAFNPEGNAGRAVEINDDAKNSRVYLIK